MAAYCRAKRSRGRWARAPRGDESEAKDEVDSHKYAVPRNPPCAARPCGDGCAPLTVFALLAAIGLAAAAWNLWMATRSWAAVGQLLSERCRSAAQGETSAGSVAALLVGDHDGCTINAARLLGQASKLGSESAWKASLSGSASVSRAVSGERENLTSELKPLCQMGSATRPSVAPPPELKHIVKWQNGSLVSSSPDVAFPGITSDGIEGLAINLTGYYFVYSKVGHVVTGNDSQLPLPSTHHQLLRRRSSDTSLSEPEVLVRAQKTRCWPTPRSDSLQVSSYVGAVFLLCKGDVVTVNVDNMMHTWHSPQRTYLGALLVSSASKAKECYQK